MSYTERQVIDTVVPVAIAEAERLIAESNAVIDLSGNVLQQQLQIFSWLGDRFFIYAAMQLTKDRPPNFHLDVREFYAQYVASKAIDIDWRHVHKADPYRPPILIPYRTFATRGRELEEKWHEHELIIDGVHRVARAYQLRIHTIPAHLLSAAEADEIRVVSEPAGVRLGEHFEWGMELIGLLPMLTAGDKIIVKDARTALMVKSAIRRYELDPNKIEVLVCP